MIKYEEYAKINLKINGRAREVVVRPADTLLRVLREKLGLTGAKIGCENGDCGACTVLLENRTVKSCMVLACEADGKAITTVEGLPHTDLQEAFIEKGGFQCGFCTSGFLVKAHALLMHEPQADEARVKTWLESNICRCTGYQSIERALQQVRTKHEHTV